jgi:spore maturation protein CgeB
MAAGGFLLSEDWPGRESDFEAGRDLVIFESLADLTRKIRYYLRNQTEREAIALAGFNKVQQFSRNAFAERVIRIVGERA